MRVAPRTLTVRLVATAVLLAVAATLVVGLVATLATRAALLDRLDDDVRESLQRAPGAFLGAPPSQDRDADGDRDERQGDGPGAPPDLDVVQGVAVGAVVAVWDPARTDTDEGASGRVLAEDGDGLSPTTLDRDALDVLQQLPADGRVRWVDLPGLGSYRVAVDAADRLGQGAGDDRAAGLVLASALPADDVEGVVGRLVVWQCALLAGVAAATLAAGTWLVRRQLRPLREVAGTARAVAGRRLSSGEVDLGERVPAHLVDDRTEVGQVGAALEVLLHAVGTALADRERSEQQVRQFVADASHELRTPLATIAGYSQLARQHPDDPAAARTALVKVEEESGRMTALVEDLLLLARLDSGRPLERAPVDLSRLLLEAVADARVVAPGHRWRLALPEEPVVVLGDELRLHQVVTNLLTNARKYTPPGTLVTVAATPGGFSVHDDGPGFEPGVAARAFERFVRGDASRHRGAGDGPAAPGGVGLGLSLVQAVVEAHGGSVVLRSTPGDTVVVVRLPD